MKLTDKILKNKDELKTALIQIKVRPSLKKRVQSVLDSKDISWNDLVEAAMLQILEENEKQKSAS